MLQINAHKIILQLHKNRIWKDENNSPNNIKYNILNMYLIIF